jgi:hypothetical protein
VLKRTGYVGQPGWLALDDEGPAPPGDALNDDDDLTILMDDDDLTELTD